MRKIIILFVIVIINLGGVVQSEELLQDFDGAPKKLADFTGQGKWLVVMMWANDCHVCNQEAHQYVAFHEKHHKIDAQVLGISLDGERSKNEAKAFIARHKLNFPNIIGEPEEVAGIYEDLTGVNWFGTPTFLIYNPKGELRAQQVGAVPVNLIEDFMKKESKGKK